MPVYSRHTRKWQLLKRSYDFGARDSIDTHDTFQLFCEFIESSEVNGEMLERITGVIRQHLTSLADYFDKYFTFEDIEAFDWISVCIL